MKMNFKNIIGITITVIALNACSDSASTEPGKGPGFPADITAKELWQRVSLKTYTPSSLDGQGNNAFKSGTADCEESKGTATIVDKVPENNTDLSGKESTAITYKDCLSNSGLTPYRLTINGKKNLDIEYKADKAKKLATTSGSVQQHMSYSGDMGFAADCDFSISETFDYNAGTLSNASATGECVYVDSEGKTLTFSAAEMKQTITGK